MGNLWEDTPGRTFTDKFAVLLVDAPTHHHGRSAEGKPSGHPYVTFNSAVEIVHALEVARNESLGQCAHGVPLVSKIGGPSNYCKACERAGVAFVP